MLNKSVLSSSDNELSDQWEWLSSKFVYEAIYLPEPDSEMCLSIL